LRVARACCVRLLARARAKGARQEKSLDSGWHRAEAGQVTPLNARRAHRAATVAPGWSGGTGRRGGEGRLIRQLPGGTHIRTWGRFPLTISVALLALTLALTPYLASGAPTNLLDASLGPPLSTRQISKVRIVRVDPWIARALTPTPALFAKGQVNADAEAIFTDLPGIHAIVSTLRNAKIPATEGCYDATYPAQSMPVSWGIFLYNDDTVLGSIYLARDGLCASTGSHMYAVDPLALSIYLQRNFSFMNF
jgi:hypothetical protein